MTTYPSSSMERICSARVRLAQSVSSRRARAMSSLLFVNDASMTG